MELNTPGLPMTYTWEMAPGNAFSFIDLPDNIQQAWMDAVNVSGQSNCDDANRYLIKQIKLEPDPRQTAQVLMWHAYTGSNSMAMPPTHLVRSAFIAISSLAKLGANPLPCVEHKGSFLQDYLILSARMALLEAEKEGMEFTLPDGSRLPHLLCSEYRMTSLMNLILDDETPTTWLTAPRNDGSTPLHLLWKKPPKLEPGYRKIVEATRLLLARGANVSLPDADGCTALDLMEASMDRIPASVEKDFISLMTQAKARHMDQHTKEASGMRQGARL